MITGGSQRNTQQSVLLKSCADQLANPQIINYFQQMSAPDTSFIKKQIADVPAWWHNIDIHGITTPGITPPASQQWIASHIDEDLSGLDVLDIGAWDGAYSFLAEQRGAKRVLAADPEHGPCEARGFYVARELLDSKVERKKISVYDLGLIKEQFDRVFYFGVYYHLDDPLLAFYKIYDRLKPGGTLLMEGLARSGSKPYMYTYQPGVDMNPGDFCAATVPWLKLACERAGFESVEFLSRYKGDNIWEYPVRSLAWHLRLHMGRFKKAHRIMIKATKPLKPRYKADETDLRDGYLANYLQPTVH